MYGKMLKNVIFPIYWRYAYRKKPGLMEYRRYLEESQWYDQKRIKEIQLQNLKKLLNHAYENVPHYRDKLDRCGFEVSKFEEFEQLHKIPFLTRNEVNKYFKDELLAKNIPPTERIINQTSGSTGAPTLFFQDAERNIKNLAIAMRSDSWAGWDLDKKKANVWFQHLITPGVYVPSKNIIRRKLSGIKKGLLHQILGRNNVFIDPFYFGPSEIKRQLEKLYEFEPDIIFGYASPVFFIAKYIKENGLPQLRPKGIILTSEPVFPGQREILKEVFSSPIFVRYAARETGTMAMQCSDNQNLHVNVENTYIEIIKDGQPAPPGQEGEIVITDLTNYTMPFIRYNIEDVSAIVEENCACGRQLPLIRPLLGRSCDMLYTPDGRCFWGAALNPALWQMNWVKQFQVHQLKIDQISVKIVKGDNFSEHEFGIVKNNLANIFGPKVNIEYIFVHEIPLSKSGKFRFIISELQDT
jgi:phenylacetate-CoA ligase